MLVWDQSKGEMTRDGVYVGQGYAGNGRGINSPSMQSVVGIGPIPQGQYYLTVVKNSPNTGPFTIVLEPAKETNTFGRSAFRIHGDNVKGNRSASHGCIILPRAVREKIWASGDKLLKVIE